MNQEVLSCDKGWGAENAVRYWGAKDAPPPRDRDARRIPGAVRIATATLRDVPLVVNEIVEGAKTGSFSCRYLEFLEIVGFARLVFAAVLRGLFTPRSDGWHLVAARIDGRCGAACLYDVRHRQDGSSALYVVAIVVAQPWRRSGIARKMLHDIVRRSISPMSVKIACAPHNLPMHRILRQEGFFLRRPGAVLASGFTQPCEFEKSL